MAHRGRLNVLANILNKSYESMLKEFEGSDYNLFDIDGDVKYHLGYATEVKTPTDKKMRLYLSPNPSHLEAVNPVVEGFTRARQNLLKDAEHQKVLPILMHGDASIAGQGIVAETFNLANLAAYKTGGTLHIIINNQVGFTTEPYEHRSSDYSSEISKMVRAPVLHVNADDPEAAVWCAELAVAFRQKFGRDIVIDLIGYRRHGHNEGDEPAFTQPLMYKKIAKHPTVLTKYTEQLVSEGSFTAEECKKVAKDFKDRMQAAYETVHGVANPKIPAPVIPPALQKCMSYQKADRDDVNEPVETGISAKSLKDLATKLTTIPEGFSVHKKLQRLIEQRQEMVAGKGNVDWGFGELLALASISSEGHHVRFTGQDVARGTFTSRHAVWVDTEDGKRFNSLSKLSDKQGDVHIVNSPLSEQGCLGFEFGYAVADPDALVIWEAQFGDFSNGAQIIIDQFLSASEAKWKQCVSLVMLLPHGHEGQGPEHSSARPERYLQLCGNLNMQVVNSTTPAQHFHVLRRQMHRNFRKPLIVMTPKSLLRAPVCTSELVEFEKGRFHEVLDDKAVKDPKKIERIVICSGKIYYELLKVRDEKKEFAQVPLVRLEQLYPFPYNPLKKLFKRYANLKEVIWTQEEPQNMGSWHFVLRRFNDLLDKEQKLSYVGRKNSGTTAEGSGKAHETEQNRIIEDALSRAIGKNTEKKTKA
jgi:2-oxoglutarate dehydrogenase E1 component